MGLRSCARWCGTGFGGRIPGIKLIRVGHKKGMRYHGFEWSCAVCGVCHGHFHPALWVDLCGCGAMGE